MNKIRFLDDAVINQIAAGEVVERPASVVKELVENAIDAGASQIELEIREGGLQYIRVEDDGNGIEADQIPLAFARHATSKLRSEADLWSLTTMGFRGEALPSIAAVSLVEMVTNPGSGAHEIRVEGGIASAVKPAAFPKGTRITVRDLFFNTPARKKFMKSQQTEGNHVYEAVVRLALANPGIGFKFLHEGRTVFQTDGLGSLNEAAYAVLGADYARRMVPVESHSEGITVTGLLSKPEFTRKNRKGQYFLVNRRPVRNPVLSAALEDGYRGFLVGQEKPVAVLNLELDPAQVDVNVHPQKLEVKFSDERAVFLAIKRAARAVLGGPTLDWRPGAETASSQTFGLRTQPFSVAETTPEIYRTAAAQSLAFPEPEAAAARAVAGYQAPVPVSADFRPAAHRPVMVLGQWRENYIVAAIEDALYIIDQHAAHERVLYNRLRQAPEQVLTQVLFLPLAVELPGDLHAAALSQKAELAALGFEIDEIGERSLAIRAVPATMIGKEVEALQEILESRTRCVDELREQAFKVMACKAAVKAGQKLEPAEMVRLMDEWLEAENRGFCPHGRPVAVSLSETEILRQIKRI
ncbi:MAG: DNA mismatch repair endonuclease MutL [Solirubrobacterales bacterium]